MFRPSTSVLTPARADQSASRIATMKATTELLLRHFEQRLKLALDEAVGVGRQQRLDLVEAGNDVGGIGD